MIAEVTGEVSRPILRGWSHAIAIVPAVVGMTVLLLAAPDNPGQRASFAVYGVALVLMFTVSTLYHRGPWSPRLRAIWRRVDHATIFLMIAGTYTAVAGNLRRGATLLGLLAAVWITAGVGVAVEAGPMRGPRTGVLPVARATRELCA